MLRDNGQRVLRYVLVVLCAFAGIQPVHAIDCTKAESRIERAICSDAALRQKDAEFTELYIRLRRDTAELGAPSEREILLAEQRDWLQHREQACADADDGRLRQCIDAAIRLRWEQLAYAWGTRAADQDPLRGKQLSVASATLSLATPCPDDPSGYALRYKGKAIACGWRGLYREPPFVVRRRLVSGDGEAALLEGHDGGQMNCSRYYILSVEAHDDLRVHEFGTSCLTPNGHGGAFRSANGFEFIQLATAASRLRNTADVYSMSGCRIYLEGYYVRCSGEDALAVWDKQTRQFYFAIVHDGDNGKRQPPTTIHAFPAIEAWSDTALAQFKDWQTSTRWEKSE